jgi:hypothetical protein
MKLIQVAAFVFVLLVVSMPDETEALPIIWFVRIAAALGMKLVRNAYYASCKTRNVPAGLKCRSRAFGMGMSRSKAENAARKYASRLGNRSCGKYVGSCKIYKFGGKGK